MYVNFGLVLGKKKKENSLLIIFFYFNCVVLSVGLIFLKEGKLLGLFLKDDICDIFRVIRLFS